MICDKCQRLLKVHKDWEGKIVDKYCPVHKSKYRGIIEKKPKIGKYSGFSKNTEWGRNAK